VLCPDRLPGFLLFFLVKAAGCRVSFSFWQVWESSAGHIVTFFFPLFFIAAPSQVHKVFFFSPARWWFFFFGAAGTRLRFTAKQEGTPPSEEGETPLHLSWGDEAEGSPLLSQVKNTLDFSQEEQAPLS